MIKMLNALYYRGDKKMTEIEMNGLRSLIVSLKDKYANNPTNMNNNDVECLIETAKPIFSNDMDYIDNLDLTKLHNLWKDNKLLISDFDAVIKRVAETIVSKEGKKGMDYTQEITLIKQATQYIIHKITPYGECGFNSQYTIQEITVRWEVHLLITYVLFYLFVTKQWSIGSLLVEVDMSFFERLNKDKDARFPMDVQKNSNTDANKNSGEPSGQQTYILTLIMDDHASEILSLKKIDAQVLKIADDCCEYFKLDSKREPFPEYMPNTEEMFYLRLQFKADSEPRLKFFDEVLKFMRDRKDQDIETGGPIPFASARNFTKV